MSRWSLPSWLFFQLDAGCCGCLSPRARKQIIARYVQYVVHAVQVPIISLADAEMSVMVDAKNAKSLG